MNPKGRSGVLMLLLPGLVVGTVYIYLGKPRLEKEAEAAIHDAAVTRTRVPTRDQEVAQASRELDLREDINSLEGALALSGPGAAVAGSGEKLALLLARQRVLLLEEVVDPSGASAPSTLDRARLRQLRLAGRYLDVLSTLRGLLDPSIGAIPLRLGMSRENGDVRWTLLLWM